MKAKSFSALVAIVAAVTLSSCATEPPRHVSHHPITDDPGHRVYTQEDLKRTGRDTNTGEALEHLDPSFNNGGRR
jgi:hypothetical protein